MSKLEELLKKARLPWSQHGSWVGEHAEFILLAVNNIGPCVEALREAQDVIWTEFHIRENKIAPSDVAETYAKIEKALAALDQK